MRRIGLVLLLCGCEQVKRLPPRTEVVPEPVWEVLDESCNAAQGCHEDTSPIFERTGGFVGTAVEPFDLMASSVYIEIEEGRMPRPPGELDDAGKFILYGWIADGAELVDVSDADTDTDTDTDTGSDTTAPPDYDAFVAVLEIIRSNCGGMNCHRDGGVVPPLLGDAQAYDSLVSGMATVGEAYVDVNNVEGSWVMVRLTAAQNTTVMPIGMPLSDAEIDVFRTWIADGANL